MACYVYILGALDGTPRHTYVGWTVDLGARVEAHNSGKGAKFTRGRRWALLYAEKYRTRTEAMRREWHLKRDRRFRGGLYGPETP